MTGAPEQRTSSWRICDATPADENALVELERAAFGTASWGVQGVRDSMTAPHTHVLLARKHSSNQLDSGHTGFAIWRYIADGAELLTIGVAPDERGAGAGKALVARVEAEAEARGLAYLFLEVDSGNTVAVSLYRKLGFKQVGSRKHYYRNGADALVMRKNLGG